jgi:hypothetical protein
MEPRAVAVNLEGASQHVADWLRARDGESRVIMAELVESAGKLASSWASALSAAEDHPQRALSNLTDMEVLLVHFVGVERRDLLRTVRAGIRMLDAALPEDVADPSDKP